MYARMNVRMHVCMYACMDVCMHVCFLDVCSCQHALLLPACIAGLIGFSTPSTLQVVEVSGGPPWQAGGSGIKLCARVDGQHDPSSLLCARPGHSGLGVRVPGCRWVTTIGSCSSMLSDTVD